MHIVASVTEHYARHLGPVYPWMMGGVEAAMESGGHEVRSLCVTPSLIRVAVDLGAGFGMHAIPLARLGFSVLAIDSCRPLLDVLRIHRGDLPIVVVEDDLRAFRRHIGGRVALVVCMGDTLTHLPDLAAVRALVKEVSEVLSIGGTFVLTFRDYSTALDGDERFIAVRSDGQRSLTCFLEYDETRVTVHDLLLERNASQWDLRVSSYAKLRLAPPHVVDLLASMGFAVRREAGPGGMVRIVAVRI